MHANIYNDLASTADANKRFLKREKKKFVKWRTLLDQEWIISAEDVFVQSAFDSQSKERLH